MTNPYCERVGIPAPRLEESVGREGVKLLHLAVIALLERGGPMTLDEIVERLSAAGVRANTGDLGLSIKKAWHGQEPLYRDPDGRFGLNVGSDALRAILWSAGLKQVQGPPVPPPELQERGDHEPLTLEEVEAAFRNRALGAHSQLQMVAAVLDAHGQAMTPESVEACLAGLTSYRPRLRAETVRQWQGRLVSRDESGYLRLGRESPDLGPMRRATREMARPVLALKQRDEGLRGFIEKREAELEELRRRQEREAAALRRAVVRVVPDPAEPYAAALLDAGARSLRTFVGEELPELARELAKFDLLAGLHIWDTLHALGLDPLRWRVVDLRPPKKNHRLNRQGRTLKITPELLIAGTTGIGRALGDPSKVADYLARGDRTRLSRRLESDAKALWAFYSYGVLHGSVRLRWGFLDERLLVEWAQPGDVSLYEILKRAGESGREVHLVLGSAPGWEDPWARARRVRVVDVDSWHIQVKEGQSVSTIPRDEIQAIRVGADPQ